MLQFKTLFFVAFSTFAMSSFAQWTEVEWSQTDGISNIDFVDDETGYAQMNMLQGFTSSFEKTTDGGQTWTELNIPVMPTDIQDMDFLADGNGVIVTRRWFEFETITQVFRTFDDGENWIDISPLGAATGYGFAGIQLLDENSIFFVIDDYLYKTSNGGDDWNSYMLPSACMSVNFSDLDHGTVGTWDGSFMYAGGMLATSDGGETWNETVLDIGSSVIGVVHQFSPSMAYAAPVKWGANGQNHFYKSTDNGLTWINVETPVTDDMASLTGFDFRDENNGVITLSSNTDLYIYRTADGGDVWELQNQMELLYISDMNITENSGYIAGEGGHILRMNAPLSLNEYENELLTVYPNPSSTGAFIQWESSINFNQITITDLSGKVVVQQALMDQNFRIPELQKGVYFTRLQNQKEFKSFKLVLR